ncbi:hypothetical protein [Aquimonas sp.]|jgi:hypothetical protein|uniref:hypothetical protein n=1 Tax=Aquimonas sp. TaxID=1872588 RepID=UPI0037BF25C6
MAAPTYDQVTGRLYALSSSADSGLADYWAGYAASAGAGFGASANLSQVWADQGGVYLFLKHQPADPEVFLAGLLALLPQLSPQGWLRMLWIGNPDDAPFYWRTQRLDALPVSQPEGDWRLVRGQIMGLGDYAVSLDGGASLTLSLAESQEGVAISASALSFVAPGAVYPAQGSDGGLPLVGAHVGCLGFQILLTHGGEADDDMNRLGVMFRYGIADADSQAGMVDAIDMPLFRQQDATPITLTLTYDPVNPLASARTALCFFPAPGTPPALDYAQRTNTGHATRATPMAAGSGLPGARLAFGRTPLFHADDETGASFLYHLTPDGAFSLQSLGGEQAAGDGADPIAGRLILGASGAEYVALTQASGCVVLFGAGNDAYVPPVAPDAAPAQVERVLLNGLGTTGWATVLPPSPGGVGLTFYAQPLQAPLFGAASGAGTGFLRFHEMPAATLPVYASGQALPAVMPVGVYSRVAPAAIDAASLIETAALAPMRRQVVGLPDGHQSLAAFEDPLDSAPLAVTPKGLIALLNEAETRWAGVLFANMPDSLHQRLTLTEVGPELQSALQSNQLFMVVSNVDTFMQGSSVAYQLTAADAVTLMLSEGVPADVALSVNAVLAAQTPPYPLYPNEVAFNAVVSDAAGEYLPQVQAAAGLLRADIEGWNFQLSPRAWRSNPSSPTLMLLKYCDRPLTELASDPASWGWKDAARNDQGSLNPTLAVLNGMLAAARLRAIDPEVPPTDPYAVFYNEIASNPQWNGVLFLNAPVDFTQMPEALQFMAAGVDATKFYAHHIGFSVTPYDALDGVIRLGQTAAFGLIDYNDPQDLVASATIPFGFKTLQMQVRFANARVADFSAKVELMVNQLFGSWLAKTAQARGNNLILDGSYQRVGGAPSYTFALEPDNVFMTGNAALIAIDILSARLETSSTPVEGVLTSRFVLSGQLQFTEIEGFDLFSYGIGADGFVGHLAFDGLAVGMSFPLATPEQQSFHLTESAIAFDTAGAATEARPASLAENFPIQLLGLVASPNLSSPGTPPTGATPGDLGYTSISAPLDQTPLTAPWYGLSFALDMGTLGALSGAIGLKIEILAAWAPVPPGSAQAPVFLGIKLGVSNAINGSLPLQGVLKLGFRSFMFETYTTSQGQLAYLLRMRRFALSLLIWSFPPGNADLLLFGAPGAPKSSLGWYAAYAKQDSKKKTARVEGAAAPALVAAYDPARRALSGRRTPPVS